MLNTGSRMPININPTTTSDIPKDKLNKFTIAGLIVKL